MKCSKCGKEIADDSIFCEFCGSPVRNNHKKKIIWITLVLILVLLGGLANYQMGIQSRDQTQVSESANYIDLGLPSGTKWKEANETNETGDFFTYEEAINLFGDKLPTKEQFEELINQCKWTWNGTDFTATGPNGNSIILSANNYGSWDGEMNSWEPYYWSSTQNGSEEAWSLGHSSDSLSMFTNERWYSFSVRLVQD